MTIALTSSLLIKTKMIWKTVSTMIMVSSNLTLTVERQMTAKAFARIWKRLMIDIIASGNSMKSEMHRSASNRRRSPMALTSILSSISIHAWPVEKIVILNQLPLTMKFIHV